MEKLTELSKYELTFWFEHGGTCIWGKNDSAKEKYGYAIVNERLPISKELIDELNNLEKESIQRTLIGMSPKTHRLGVRSKKGSF